MLTGEGKSTARLRTSLRLLLAIGLIAIVIVIRPLYGLLYDATVYVEAKMHTEYSNGFSQVEFDAIEVGDSRESVVKRLGEPFSRTLQRLQERLTFSNGLVVVVSPANGDVVDVLKAPPTEELRLYSTRSMTYSDLVSKFGAPTEVATDIGAEFWSYSRSDRNSHYFIRGVLVSLGDQSKVIRKSKIIFHD